MRHRLLAGLHRDVVVVVVATHRALGAQDHESTLGLRLDDPRIGEGAPTGLELGESVSVAGHHDAVLIDFEPGGFIDHGRDFDRTTAPLVPGAQSGSVTQVIEQ